MKKSSKIWITLGAIASICTILGLSFKDIINIYNSKSTKTEEMFNKVQNNNIGDSILNNNIIRITGNDSSTIEDVKIKSKQNSDSISTINLIDISNNKNSNIKNIENETNN